jgi:beta-galactosidase
LRIIDLNDKWYFAKVNNLAYVLEEISEAESVTLPHSWNAEDGRGNGNEVFKGKCWYQRRLNISAIDLNKYIYLETGAAGNVSEVYINGQLSGSSKCGYAMYRVSLNTFLKAGDNLISIMIDNSQHEDVYPLMADFTFYGGLYREVKLIIADAFHFDLLDNGRDGIYLTQKYIGEKTFEVNIKGSVINEFSCVNEGKLNFYLCNKDEQIVFSKNINIEVSNKYEFNLTEEIS